MNLLSKLHKNSILTGPIESYCLACGCILRSEEESYAHIHLPHHVDKLQALPQLEGYKDDCIIKIKEGYFCPYCNIILPTIKRISLHVVESKHKEKKISQLITRHAGTIFLFDIVVIDPRSWHGVDGTTCSVCNEDYADEKEHTNEPGHTLKLIQAKCEFGENFVYRNVDEDLFFCLICNDILPIIEKETHHQSKRHLELYEKSTKEGVAIKSKKSTEQNNNIAIDNSNNISPEVKPKESTTNVKNVNDTKDTSNNIVNVHVTKVDNGSSCYVDDNRATVKTDSQGFNSNNVNLSTDKSQNQVPSTVPTNKTQEIAKVTSQTKDTQKQNAQEVPKITPTKVTQESGEDLKSIDKTSKVNEKVSVQNNDTQEKDNLNKEQESKNSNEKTEDAAKNIEVQFKEVKDSATPSPKEPKTNTPEPVKPATVKLDTDSTVKDPGSSEPYLYEFLKSLNFVIRTIDNEAFCTLCDVSVDVPDIGIHCVDKHHSILYQKHIARKNKPSEKNAQDTDNLKKEKINKIASGKENTVPPTAQEKAQKTTGNIDKPVEACTKNVCKEAKVDKDKNNQVEQVYSFCCACVAPDNKVGNEGKPVLQLTLATKDEPSREKPNKKSQKKAAKAKAELISSQIRTTSGSSSPNIEATDTRNQTNDSTYASVIDKATIETNLNLVDVNKNVTEINETSITVNEKATETYETPVKTTNNVHEANETTNNTMADVKLKTEMLMKFIKTISQVDSSPEDVVINCKYAVGNLSFVLLMRTGNKVECVACNEKLTIDMHKHISTEEHRLKVEECPVVTSLDGEFIRQVKTDEYHCGYCNMTLPDWDETKEHLKSYRHSDAKTSAAWRLERYLPHMKHCEKKEVRSALTSVFRRTME